MKNLLKHSGTIVLLICMLGAGKSYAGPADSTATRPATAKNALGVSLTPAYCGIFNYPKPGFFNMSYRAGISYRLGLNHSNSLYLFSELGYLQNTFTQRMPNDIESIMLDTYGSQSYYNAVTRYNYVYLRESVGYTFWHLSKTKNDYLFAVTGLQGMYNFSTSEVDKGVILPPATSPVKVWRGRNRVSDMEIAWMGGIGFSMNLSSKISTTITPEISYEFGSMTYQSFYNLGLNFQVLYNF